MGLKILTVEFVNGEAGRAGSVLFNSNRVLNDAKLIDADDTHFSYAKDINAVIGDKYWVSETLTTFDDIYASPSVNFYTLPVYADSNDAASKQHVLARPIQTAPEPDLRELKYKWVDGSPDVYTTPMAFMEEDRDVSVRQAADDSWYYSHAGIGTGFRYPTKFDAQYEMEYYYDNYIKK
jgi:hypothetical protein